MSPHPKLRIAEALSRAFMARDVNAFAEHVTEDAVIRPSAFVTGRGEYVGREGIAASFREFDESLEGKVLQFERVAFYEDGADPNKLLSLVKLKIIRHTGGDPFGTDIAYLHTFRGDKVARLDTWLDHQDGLAQLKDPVRIG